MAKAAREKQERGIFLLVLVYLEIIFTTWALLSYSPQFYGIFGYSATIRYSTIAVIAQAVAIYEVWKWGRGARIGSRFLNNLGFVKAVFGAQIGIYRIVMSAICPPIANSYHLSLITLRVSS
jgi:hypothetical protein